MNTIPHPEQKYHDWQVPKPQNPFTAGKLVGVDYDAELYHAMEGGKRGEEDFIMSRSELMEFDHCPQRWLRGVEDDRDAATEFGSLVDCVVTAPKSLKRLFAVYPREYVNKQGEVKPWNNNADVCRLWKVEQGEDKTFIKQDIMDKARLAQDRLKEDKRIAALMKASDRQVCVTALYPCKKHKLAIAVKALIDLVPRRGEYADCLVELKTDRNAEPRKWTRTVFERDYHVQAAMYLDMYNAATGGHRERFLHAIVENVPPFETARRMLSAAFIEVGRARYTAALERYCECLASGSWPGFDDVGNDLVNGWRLVEPEAYMIL